MTRAVRGFASADFVTVAVATVLLALLFGADLRGGAYELHYYALGGLVVLGLLVSVIVGAGGLPRRPRRVEVVALCAFGGLTAISFASILWAQQPAQAWDGSSRMLLYLLLAILGSVLPWRSRSAFFFITGYVVVVLAIALLALWEAHKGEASAYLFGRLSYPLGYQNANAVAFVTAYWAALIAATRGATPAFLRIALFGAAGALLPVALLSQSRASVISLALTATILMIVLPGRLRTAMGIGLTILPLAVGWGRLVGVRDAAAAGAPIASDAADRAIAVIVAAALVVATVGVLWAAFDRFVIVPTRVARLANASALILAGLAITLGAAAASRAEPVTRISNGWHDFTSVSYVGGFGGGLGSNRYDFWRVALARFEEKPIGGIGTDNFLVEYMRDRRSEESPRFPHSVEIQLLSQLGLIGGLLGLVFFGASFAGVFPRRSDEPEPAAIACAATAAATYWLIHASVDWFWEIPGTLAPVIVLLAAAGAVRDGSASGMRFGRRLGVGLSVAAVLVGIALFVPWRADGLARDASANWPSDPERALSQLADAARLNSLSPTPAWLTGQIAFELGDVEATYAAYGRAIERDPGYWYWHFERAAAASELGLRPEALREIRLARTLNPLSATLREIERRLLAGERVTLKAANALFGRSGS